jgi:hypothetical protein
MKGSCLCEAIRYEIDSIDFPISHCHCLTCQKAHSAAFATTARVMRENFRWLQGAESVAAFESSPGKLRWFCPNCGSHLVAEKDGMPYVIVRVATLDEDPGMVPELHIWTSHDRPWLQYQGQAAHQEWQPGRAG